MKPERISIGATVRVRDHHRIAERRGMVGRVRRPLRGKGVHGRGCAFPGRTAEAVLTGGPGGNLLTPTVVAFANKRWLAGDEPAQEIDKTNNPWSVGESRREREGNL
jgi:hypothetical protein